MKKRLTHQAVLISIQPNPTAKIINGKKLIEVRKSAPKIQTPFKCLMYLTQNKGKFGDFDSDTNKMLQALLLRAKGKVIGEFVCDEIITISYIESGFLRRTLKTDKPIKIKEICLNPSELDKYAFNNKGIFELPTLYGWHISDLKIYDKPKELSEFNLYCERAVEFDNMVEGQGKRINGDWRRDRCLNCIRSFPCPVRGDGDGITIAINCDRQIKTPPQSWCYVEE